MSLNTTPRANRLHVSVFGRTNSGKSTLLNAVAGQNVAIVSKKPGTTTDPVYKAMEIHPIGPVVFIDTAGFDDHTELGKEREKRTADIISETDIALVLFDRADITEERVWLNKLKEAEIPVIPIISKADVCGRLALADLVEQQLKLKPEILNLKEKADVEVLKNLIYENMPEDYNRRTILQGVASEGDLVVLVMPQDIQAPKGRLILPQVQTIRELLDLGVTTVCTTKDKFEQTIDKLKGRVNLIITDSQCFKHIYDRKPPEAKITSFSVLFAGFKGDIDVFVKGADKIDKLNETSSVLIAEACSHAPLQEDIGRVKLPAMLREKIGEDLKIDIVSGKDFPSDLAEYDLVIHCGACMFNRKLVMSRIKQAESQGVPITNYGIAIAKLFGILGKIFIA